MLFALFMCTFTVDAGSSVPLGLPEVTPRTPENPSLEALGRALFADRRLSADNTISCATCHIPEKQFTDGLPTAKGLNGTPLTRRTPTLLNVVFENSLFWDGRVSDLAEQVRSPLLAPAEHGLRNEAAVVEIVRSDAHYASAFKRSLGLDKREITLRTVALAIAAYERTLVAADSPFDQYLYGHDSTAMSPAAIRGLALFRDKARCATCHTIEARFATFTDGQFHSSPVSLPEDVLRDLGTASEHAASLKLAGKADALNALIASDREIAALGRFVVTLDPKDIGQFKTPSLRNIVLLSPYMHDGSVRTLAAAVDLELYSRSNQNYPIVLTEDERTDLLAFLSALTTAR